MAPLILVLLTFFGSSFVYSLGFKSHLSFTNRLEESGTYSAKSRIECAGHCHSKGDTTDTCLAFHYNETADGGECTCGTASSFGSADVANNAVLHINLECDKNMEGRGRCCHGPRYYLFSTYNNGINS